MSDNTQVINDQRSVNEPPKVFDSVESVDRRPIINTDRRQFVVADQPKYPEARFRVPDPNQQFQIWRQPVGRPPPGYPPPRFIPRNANEPRNFPPRNPTPLRTQEYQNRRSFEKPDRSFDELNDNPRPISPWQRIRERLPDARVTLQNANEQDMDSMKLPFEDRMNREAKDRVPPNFRRDSFSNMDPRKPQVEPRRYDDRDGFAQNDRKPSVPPGDFVRRDVNPDPRMLDQSMRRPSLTQIQMNEQNYINDRVQSPPIKPRPLQAVPEYENRNHYPVREEDHNRNYRPEGYRDFRKLSDLENTNRKYIATRPEEEFEMAKKHQQRIYENEPNMNRHDGYDPGRGRKEMNFNRIDINGSSDDRNSVRNTTNENKPPQDKKPTANGDIKPPSSLPAELKKEKSALKTSTRKISPKTPETGSTNSLGEKKKVPMNKIQVGAAPSPNLKVVRSKIGSLENYSHKPGGGKVKIENRKLEWNAQPRIEAKNDKYAPSGGEKKITQVKLQWSAKSKIGSLENATHKPGGGDKKIETVKLDFKDKAKPKVGSKDNIKHVPGGGTVKKSTDADTKSISSDIEDQKLEIKAQSKIGSLDNVKHRPGGGDKKIFDDKEYLKQTTLTNESSKANSVTTSGSQALEDSQLCSREAPKNEKPVKPITPAVTESPKKPDKAKEQIKTKVEQSPNKEKKSEPNTPKKSLAKKESSDKPTPTDIKPTVSVDVKNNAKPVIEKSSPKLDKKSEKAESKLKTDLVSEKSAPAKAAPMQSKLDNVIGLIKENSKDEMNPKNKTNLEQKPGQVESKLDTSKSTQNTDSKNLPEINKAKPGDLKNEKTKPKSENLNKEINVSQGAPKLSSISASKDSTIEKSNLSTADKQDSKIKMDNKLNQPISDKEQKKESNNSPAKRNTNNENKSNLVPSDIKDQTKPSNQDTKPLAKNSAPLNDAEQNKIPSQNAKPKEENKPNLSSTSKESPSKAFNSEVLEPKDKNKSSTGDNKFQPAEPVKTEKEPVKVLNTQDLKSNLGSSSKSETQTTTEISTKPKSNTEIKTEKDEKIITFSSTDVKSDQNGNKSDPKIINIPIAKEPPQVTGKIATQDNSSKEKEILSSTPKAISTEFKPLESTTKEIKTPVASNESPSQKQQIPSVVTLNQELKK